MGFYQGSPKQKKRKRLTFHDWGPWNLGWGVKRSKSDLLLGKVKDPLWMNVTGKEMSHEKNLTLLSIESWMVNRDPKIMVYEIIPNITG